jgi:hypothetical protein
MAKAEDALVTSLTAGQWPLFVAYKQAQPPVIELNRDRGTSTAELNPPSKAAVDKARAEAEAQRIYEGKPPQ